MEQWRVIKKGNFTDVISLGSFLELEPQDIEKLHALPNFILNLPKRLAEKIEKKTLNDPLLRQFVPLEEERKKNSLSFVKDPTEENKFRKSPKFLQKYQGRALLVTTSACAMHCRFCFRQNFPYETDDRGFHQELSLIAKDSSIEEVILSGGDPLSLSDLSLGQLLCQFDLIPHVKRIRFHTRFPIGIPERITSSFLHLLENSTKTISFVLHVNHAKEIDQDVAAALKEIQKLGIPILHQGVLLKGVNDNFEDLRQLLLTLININVIPYYLHQLDKVVGGEHFEVDDNQGVHLIEELKKSLPGFAIPRFVREEPGASSKTGIF